MSKALFVTGTDTGVGKTLVTGLLARLAAEKGVKTITQKWIQTGCDGFPEDVATHLRFMGKGEEYIENYRLEVAPYVFGFPSSPHLAAFLENKKINTQWIERAFRRLAGDFEFVIVEGSGGVMVPVNDEETIVDIVKRLDLPVLIVAENRLGAINQTMLAVDALRERGLRTVGIIFNRLATVENEIILKDNPKIVEKLTDVEVFGELPYEEKAEEFYGHFIPIGERILRKLDKF